MTIPYALRDRKDFYDGLLAKAKLLEKKIAKKIIWEPIKDGQVCIFGDYIDSADLPRDINKYLAELLRDYITPLCDLYAARIGKNYRSIAIKKLRAKWGSCSSRQELVFNRDLVHLPLAVVKYVVIHEISHLIHKHHQKSFWDLVAILSPGYKEQEKFLK
jgi:predicted metal-dependent hydrolase